MFHVRYDVPTVEIRDSAVAEEFIPPLFVGTIALTAIAVIGTLAVMCQLQGGHLYWGFTTFFGIPTGIYYECRR